MFLNIVLKYIIISIVISIIFGLTVSLSMVIRKKFKKDIIDPYLFQLLSLILFIIIWILYKPNVLIFNGLNTFSRSYILLLFIAIVPTSIIASKSRRSKTNGSFKDVLSGASMEIPQRLLIQNLFVILGVNSIIYKSLSLDIFLNAVIWVQFIMIQEVIQGKNLTKDIFPKVIASFWFSIWVGILYRETGNIFLPMFTHGLQRILTNKIYIKHSSINV